MYEDILALVKGRRGHFEYESGHHGELWFDLETICQHPNALRPYVTQLAARLEPYRPDVICGALVDGAFIALLVAQALGCEFAYAGRFTRESPDELFPVDYHLPASLHAAVKGRRVAIVNDFINAGSAVRGTYQDLRRVGAEVVAVGSLVLLGDSFGALAREQGWRLEALARIPNELWTPAECPMCRYGIHLEKPAVA